MWKSCFAVCLFCSAFLSCTITVLPVSIAVYLANASFFPNPSWIVSSCCNERSGFSPRMTPLGNDGASWARARELRAGVPCWKRCGFEDGSCQEEAVRGSSGARGSDAKLAGWWLKLLASGLGAGCALKSGALAPAAAAGDRSIERRTSPQHSRHKPPIRTQPGRLHDPPPGVNLKTNSHSTRPLSFVNLDLRLFGFGYCNLCSGQVPTAPPAHPPTTHSKGQPSTGPVERRMKSLKKSLVSLSRSERV